MKSSDGPAEKFESGTPDVAELPDDPRLMQAVQEYLKELEAGHTPSRLEFLRRYPDLMGPLAQCLDGLELVHQAGLRKKQPAGGAAADAGGGEGLPANPLGDFQIMREIGRGGMGIVYEALQLSLGRRVALKVLPFAATFDARHLQRFHNEAHAAAALHHTNIVPVFAVGCERGVHFYAMQLIEGQSLATVIHQIKRQQPGDKGAQSESRSEHARKKDPASKNQGGEAATGPFLVGSDSPPHLVDDASDTASPLSLALTTHRSSQHAKFFFTVARFMVQAAEAVEHAHQFGIVHRDIKPANLMVDVHNRLWITDFGLAQFHADAGLTQTGDILGTLRYMSPEQASGKKVLDHRTDVYSLGATLYELVTLEPIFPGRNRQELLHQIINDEPRPPRALEKSIPVELETIILKAVSKNVGDRYGTAQEFADDLQRYLDDKPIQAKRPSLVERARKWSRRHPSVVVAGVLVLLVSIVGLVVSNWMIAQEQAKTQEALRNEKERAMEARRAVDLLMDISEQELANQPYMQGIRKKLLQAALNYYHDFIDTHGSDEAAQGELQAGKEKARSLLAELATLEGLNLIGLANHGDVQQDLGISAAQHDKLVELNERLSKQREMNFRDFRPGTAEDRRRQLDFAKAQEASLTEILEPRQLQRLRQIELQWQGPRAFHDSDAVDVLKLSAEQKRKIRDFKDIAMETMEKSRPRGGPGGYGKNKQFDKSGFDKIMKAEVESIVGILTPEQKAKWQELTGPTFLGTLPPPGGGGPKGPGPPPKGPRGGPKGPPPFEP